MIQAIKQDLGMNVIRDVVYNHTNAAGPTDRTSVLDKIVPWYYQRLNETTGSVESAACCSTRRQSTGCSPSLSPIHWRYGPPIIRSMASA